MMLRRMSSVANAAVAKPPPSPRGLPVLGTILDLLAAGSAPALHRYIDSRHRELGPVFRDRIGPVDGVFVADATEMRRLFSIEGKYPAHIVPEPWLLYNRVYGYRRGLLFMEGEEWLRFRRIINKLLLRPDRVSSLLLAPCLQAAEDLATSISPGQIIPDLEGRLYCWATDVLVAVLLGGMPSPLANQTSILASSVHRVFRETSRLMLLPANMARMLRLKPWRDFVDAATQTLDRGNDMVTKLIKHCQTGNVNGNGLLPLMLAEEMDHEDVKRIVVDLLLAAGDTTAYSTQWALYLLSKDPEVQEELYNELQICSNPKEMASLPLLRGVIREALRLYPVAPFITRYLPEDDKIGGFSVPAGQLVLLSLYTSGRNSAYFPDPERFWPHRWVRNSAGAYSAVNSNYASLPFAMGARSCVGQKLAETQISLALAKIIQRFRLELDSNDPPEMILRLVSVPSKPVKILPKER